MEHTARLFGSDRQADEAGLPALRKEIADAGFYAYDTTPDEIAEFRARPDLVEQTFRRVMQETIESWLTLAEERLAGTGIQCLLAPGNDDSA